MAQVQENAPDTPLSERGSDPTAPTGAGKKLRKPSTLPQSNAIVNDAAFFDYVAALDPEADWPRVAIYGYRHWPRIIREPSYVLKIDGEKPADALDKEFILRELGSGKYNLKLNDKTSGRTIVQCNIDYSYPDRPPLIDLRELDTAAAVNRLLVEKLVREGKLTQDRQIVTPPESSDASLAQALRDVAMEAMKGKGGAGGVENLASQKAFEMIATASQKSLEVVIANLKGAGEGHKGGGELAAIMPLLIALVGAKNAPPPPAPAADNTVVTILTTMIESANKRAEAAEKLASEERKEAAAERQRQHEKDLEMLRQRGDPLDMVDKVLGLKERLGGNEPDNRKWPEKLVDELAPHVGQALDVLGKFASRPAYQPGPPRPAAAPGAGQPARPMPAGGPQPVQAIDQQPQPGQQAEPQPGETEVPQPISQDPEITFLYPIFIERGQNLVQLFSSDPGCGPMIADLVRTSAGSAVYERIARMGVDKILATVDLIPQMAADFAKAGTPEMIREFISDFIDPDGDDEDDAEPVIPEGAAPAATPINAKKGRKKAAAAKAGDPQ